METEDRKASSAIIERAVQDVQVQASRQPRFRNTQTFLRSWMQFVEKIEDKPPLYQADSRELDAYLLRILRSEPLLSSVIFQVVTRDKNRGFTLTGAKSTAERYLKVLHNLHNGKGWRYFTSLAATAFRATNLGYVAEIGYGSDGWPAQLWMVDPTRLTMSDNPAAPIKYHPSAQSSTSKTTGAQFWRSEYFISGNSMPSLEERFNGLGFCAIMRVVTLTRLMVGVNYYQLEKLGLRPPRGYLLFKGISEPKRRKAALDREEEQDDAGTEYYDDVQAIYAADSSAGIDFISLAQLPDNFNFDQLVQTIVKIYAAALGEPANTLFDIDGGQFGEVGATQVQVQEASYIGQMDFISDYQEQLQRILPRSVSLEFDERDDYGDLVRAQEADTWSQIAQRLNTPAGLDGEAILSRDEVRLLLAEKGIIPAEWTEANEEVELTDVERIRRSLRHALHVRHAAEVLPSDPIVRYHFPTGKSWVIFDRADDVLRPFQFPGAALKPAEKKRQLERIARELPRVREVLFEGRKSDDPQNQISDEDVDQAIEAYNNIEGLSDLLNADAVDSTADLES